MVFNRRRGSTSSVETVDENRIQWLKETSVLKTVPQNDSADWPIFELKDAVVLKEDGHTLENALNVNYNGPFIVRGTLVIDDPEQKRHLIMKVVKQKPIEISYRKFYSIGEADDGQAVIWVSGKGGWYEIVPSTAYLPIYNKMCEAATLYYRILDIYKDEKPERSKRQKKGKRVDPMVDLSRIFHKYAASIGDGSTLDEVIDRCMEHAPFLISQFISDKKEEFDWEPTLFYKWLTQERPHLLEKALQVLSSAQVPRKSPSAEIAYASTPQGLPSRTRAGSSLPPVAAEPSRSPQPDLRPRQRSTRSRSVAQNENASTEPATDSHIAHGSTVSTSQSHATTPPPIDDIMSPFETLVWALDNTYRELSPKGPMDPLKVMNHIYFGHKFPNYKNGTSGCHRIPVEELFHYNAQALLETLDMTKFGALETWLQELSTKEFDPVAIKPSNFPYRLVPRGTRAPRVVVPPPDPSQVVRAVSRDSNDEGLSSNSGPFSRSGKAPRGQRSGKKSSLRPRKRIHSELDSDDEVEPATKKSHYFSDGEDMAVDEAEDTSSPDEDGQADEDPIKIIIRADKIPSTTPNGPNQSWTCDEADCNYVVRGDDAKECEEQVQRHFLEHQKQSQRVTLAVAESRGHMPINHLIEKLKSMGEKAQSAEQLAVNGVPLPQRIKRKLVV